MMFFRKNERKSHSARVILTVGALAAVGAISIYNCGKQMAGDVICKLKGFLKGGKQTSLEKTEDVQAKS